MSDLAISGAQAAAAIGDAPVFTPTITGGVAPYSLDIARGVLPPGRAISGVTVTGAYTDAGTFAYTLRAIDLRGNRATVDVSTTVSALALGPAAVKIPAGALPGDQVCLLTGLAPGETIAQIVPDDDGLKINGLRNGLSMGIAGFLGPFNYTVITNTGRQFVVAATGNNRRRLLGFDNRPLIGRDGARLIGAY